MFRFGRPGHRFRRSAVSGPIELDVTDKDQIAAAAARAGDVQIVINNAGAFFPRPLLGGDIEAVHREFETNVFGPVYVTEAFAPILAANGGGAVVNALSAVSWFSFPGAAAYSATKAAAWSLTDALRLELAAQGTQVLAFHTGPVETELGSSSRSTRCRRPRSWGPRWTVSRRG